VLTDSLEGTLQSEACMDRGHYSTLPVY